MLETRQTILIVTDDMFAPDSCSDTLAGAGYELVRADSAERALASLRHDGPCAVLLDASLPAGELVPFFRSVRRTAAGRDIPVLILSPQDDVEIRLHGLPDGPDDYVHEPFSPEDVCLRVEKARRRRGRLRPLERDNLRLRTVAECGLLLARGLRGEDPFAAVAQKIGERFSLALLAIGVRQGETLMLGAVFPAGQSVKGRELLAAAGASRALEAGSPQHEAWSGGARVTWFPIRDAQGSVGVLAMVADTQDALRAAGDCAHAGLSEQLAAVVRARSSIGHILAYQG